MTGRRCNVFFSSFFCPTLGLNWPRPRRIPRLSSNPGRSISLFLLGIVAQLRPRGYYVRWNWFWWSTLWYLVQVSVQLRPEACSLIPSLSKKKKKKKKKKPPPPPLAPESRSWGKGQSFPMNNSSCLLSAGQVHSLTWGTARFRARKLSSEWARCSSHGWW